MRVIHRGNAQPVKNAPYSAQAVSERLQQLPDGNQIERRMRSASYRDSAGRTRHEISNEKGELRTVTISDPVAGAVWILHPQTKVAQRAPSPAEIARITREARETARHARRAHAQGRPPAGPGAPGWGQGGGECGTRRRWPPRNGAHHPRAAGAGRRWRRTRSDGADRPHDRRRGQRRTGRHEMGREGGQPRPGHARVRWRQGRRQSAQLRDSRRRSGQPQSDRGGRRNLVCAGPAGDRVFEAQRPAQRRLCVSPGRDQARRTGCGAVRGAVGLPGARDRQAPRPARRTTEVSAARRARAAGSSNRTSRRSCAARNAGCRHRCSGRCGP